MMMTSRDGATDGSSACAVCDRRAAIDIGSGATKLLVADVDVASGRIVKILHGEERVVSFSLASKTTQDGSLPEDIMDEGIKVLKSFRAIVDAFAIVQNTGRAHKELGIAAVATEVFRRAPNGRSYLQRVWREVCIDVRLVSQRVEAELGFMTAAAFAARDSGADVDGDGGIVCWDSGGGSFQIASLAPKEDMQETTSPHRIHLRPPYLAALGSGVVQAQCLNLLRSDDAMNATTTGADGRTRGLDAVHPLNRRQFDLFVDRLMAQMPPIHGSDTVSDSNSALQADNSAKRKRGEDVESFDWIAACPVVTAIGGITSMFRLPGAILGWDHLPSFREGRPSSSSNAQCIFTMHDVEAAVAAVLDKDDDEISNLFVQGHGELITGNDDSISDDNAVSQPLETAIGTTPPKVRCFREGLEPHLMCTKLALLLATMRHTGMIAARYVFAIGSCPGVLVHPSFRTFTVATIDV